MSDTRVEEIRRNLSKEHGHIGVPCWICSIEYLLSALDAAESQNIIHEKRINDLEIMVYAAPETALRQVIDPLVEKMRMRKAELYLPNAYEYNGYGTACGDWAEELSAAFQAATGKPLATKQDTQIYCHACSVAGGADMPIYHTPPACKPLSKKETRP